MKRHVYLKDALKEYPELSRKLVGFTPDSLNEAFFPSETGYEPVQVKSTKSGLKWHAFLYDNVLCLIPEVDTLSTNLLVSANIGSVKERELLGKYSKMYNKKDLGARGVAFESDMLPFLPTGYLDSVTQNCYIASNEEKYFRYFHVIIPGGTIAQFSHSVLNFVVVPVVKLPPDVIVTLGDPAHDGSSANQGLNLFRIYEYC